MNKCTMPGCDLMYDHSGSHRTDGGQSFESFWGDLLSAEQRQELNRVLGREPDTESSEEER